MSEYNYMSFSLPVHQDCHEMWSKKKRKKEKERLAAANSTSSSTSTTNSATTITTVAATARTTHTITSTANTSRQDYKSFPSSSTLPPQRLAVPLPSAPLPTASILESLTSSLSEGAALNNSGSKNGNSVVSSSTEFKKVIAKAQRNLIDQITQKLEQEGTTSRGPPLVSSISGRATQSFDYGNQSNKDLEAKSVAQLYNKDHHSSWT